MSYVVGAPRDVEQNGHVNWRSLIKRARTLPLARVPAAPLRSITYLVIMILRPIEIKGGACCMLQALQISYIDASKLINMDNDLKYGASVSWRPATHR